MNLGTASVIRGNARDLPLANNSVDLIISSPPYWSLRSYQDDGSHYEGQIGSEANADDFLDALLDVMRECARVLKPSGSIFYNLGDKYGPNKSLALIPERFRIRCTDELGLIARAVIVWSKPNGLPESVTDRVRRSHEDWMHFTLEPRYFSAVDEIREAHKPGQSPSALSFNRTGREAAPGQTMAPHRVGRDDQGLNPLGKLPGSVWTVPTEPLRVPDHLGIDHFAAFPTEWPKRIIQGWSPQGVCVECGEGRRPVGVSTITADRGGRQFNPASGNVGILGKEREFRLTGYACACGTQSGEAWIPKPPQTNYESEPTASRQQFRRASRRTMHAPATTPPPTRPAVVLDPFGGTGTTAMVAKALGRHGITVDMSADYCRLAEWRTNDRNQLAKVLGVDKAPEADVHQLDLFGEATA